MDISPKYLMQLIDSISEAIWKEYSSYEKVMLYIEKWHRVEYDNWNNHSENFEIVFNGNGKIDLLKTLHNISGELLIKIAIDNGVDTPDYIPSIPVFRNELKAEYNTASMTFEKAFKQVETDPSLAIGLANSALESILKEVLKDERLAAKMSGSETLYDLTSKILKAFEIFPGASIPKEINQISNGLLGANQGIEKLRSTKTLFHGKTDGDRLIEDSIYAYFIINSVTSIGLFINRYYKFLHPKPISEVEDDDLPF